MFPSVFLNEIRVEPFTNPSFLVKNILKNMASSFMFEKQKLEKSEKTRRPRNACYNSVCIQDPKPSPMHPGQRSDSFKRLWYSYAF